MQIIRGWRQGTWIQSLAQKIGAGRAQRMVSSMLLGFCKNDQNVQHRHTNESSHDTHPQHTGLSPQPSRDGSTIYQEKLAKVTSN